MTQVWNFADFSLNVSNSFSSIPVLLSIYPFGLWLPVCIFKLEVHIWFKWFKEEVVVVGSSRPLSVLPQVVFSYFTGAACAVDTSVTTSSTDFSFQNLVFWNLFKFSAAENHLKINISHILNPNLKINSIKSSSSSSFQQHQRQIPIPPKFWVAI